jgi:hypothetical protein
LGLDPADLCVGVGKDWRVGFVCPDICRLHLVLWVLVRLDPSSQMERWGVDSVVKVFVGARIQTVQDEVLGNALA